MIIPLIGLGSIVALAALAIHLQRNFYFFQYLYFCRFPLLTALVLSLLLPLAMLTFAGAMIGNLAVLGFKGVMVVSLGATLTAWLAMLSLSVILEWVPRRNRLGFYRPEAGIPIPDRNPATPCRKRLWSQMRSLPDRILQWLFNITRYKEQDVQYDRLLFYLLLAIPLIATVMFKSYAAGAENSGPLAAVATNTAAALLGIGLAFVVRVIGSWIGRLITSRHSELLGRVLEPAKHIHRQAARAMDEPDAVVNRLKGYVDPISKSRLLKITWHAAGFLVMVAIFYWILGIIFHPQRTSEGPSLLMVLVILMGLCLILSAVSIWLDKFRIPVVLMIIGSVFAFYLLFDIDHYYQVSEISESRRLTPRHVFHNWRTTHPVDRYPSMVLVTASGGGITAARWTTEVLTRLQAEIPRFGDSMILVSTTSGGSVGALYFVDAYRGGSPPHRRRELESIKRRSGASSLLATAWGFAYRDMWWVVPFLDHSRDRGWALEVTWKRRLNDATISLDSWRRELQGDWRPVQVFNATITESGERFLLTPMNVGADPASGGRGETAAPWDAKNFLDIYPNRDVLVVTAARLSATFPFVSPISRPPKKMVDENKAFHIADGGYYDNHGVASAIDFLRDILPVYEDDFRNGAAADESVQSGRKSKPTVILVQIRSGETKNASAKPRRGYRYALTGPIDTLMKVRTASQISRNDVELKLLQDLWADRVDIKTWVFNLGGVDAPLSWHLTEADTAAIEAGWTETHRKQLAAIKSILTTGG